VEAGVLREKVKCWDGRTSGVISVPDRRLCLAGVLLFALPLTGQTKSVEQKPAEQGIATSSPTKESEVPDVPGLSSVLRGFNAGVTVSGVHDTYTGWGTSITPALGYSFNNAFSVDVSVPIYFFRLAPTTKARPKPNALLVPTRGEVGDVVIAGHMHFAPERYEYQATAALAVPTGDAKDGLTTGLTAFDFSNHFDVPVWKITPNLDVGLGDNASLVNRISTKNYQPSQGPLSHFQAGIGFSFPHGISFDAAAFEQLPVGDQKTYAPAPGAAGRNGVLVVTGRKIAEDNGMVSSLDIPVGGHMTFSAYYNRSVRYRADTVAIGYTYVLRGAKPEIDAIDPTIDELIRGGPASTPASKP
jgi:hypothetical protein